MRTGRVECHKSRRSVFVEISPIFVRNRPQLSRINLRNSDSGGQFWTIESLHFHVFPINGTCHLPFLSKNWESLGGIYFLCSTPKWHHYCVVTNVGNRVLTIAAMAAHLVRVRKLVHSHNVARTKLNRP
jgi:hypothetical protein